MPAYIARPTTVFPQHQITTTQIADDIRHHHADHPKLAAILRIVVNTGVQTRYFSRPLDTPTVSGTAGVGDRAAAAFGDALDLATEAARRTLTAHRLNPVDVDAVITTHSTGWAVPNLDIHLVERLGLRPNVRRIALTTMACAAWAPKPSSAPSTWWRPAPAPPSSSSPPRSSPRCTTTPTTPSST